MHKKNEMQFFFSTICWQALVVIHNGYIIIPSRTGKYHPLYTLNNLGFSLLTVFVLGKTLRFVASKKMTRKIPLDL